MRPEHAPEISRFFFEHARDILVVLDAVDGRVVDANEAAELAYGYPRSELLDMTVYDLRADPADVPVQMKAADMAGVLFETLHRRKDGTILNVEVNSRGVTIGERRLLLSVIRDITERKRHEREREALIETTQRALALRDEFLVVASHELRSPITNVSLQLQQLERMLERAELFELLPQMQAARGEVTRLATLINTLLDAQNVKGGHIALARSEVDLADLVRDVAERLRPRAELAGSPIVIDVRSQRGQWDRLRLDQVFTNLLVNALKYGRGRPIQILGDRAEGFARIDVRDQGIGVSHLDADRIFEKFERAVPAAYGGFGLGLYITRQLVEAHGGSITLCSTPGQGSTFSVALPLD
ncbi:MAG: PAS domain-containing sensor histidine kinase [Kofleriaceae bacterium]|nr:PAS domain-containing sensor histidine kinase [Kofleriaceae bacterium]